MHFTVILYGRNLMTIGIPQISTITRPRKVVILNDTSRERHHGCRLVMENLYRELAQRNVPVYHVHFVHDKVDTDKTIAALSSSDIAIINGEGTIHHGRPKGERLLSVVAKYGAGTKVLINATYDSNPERYRQYLDRFHQIYVRDRMSHSELSNIGIASTVVPDLTFAGTEITLPRSPQIAFVCSVDRDVSVLLHKLGRIYGRMARPLSILHANGRFGGRLSLLRRSLCLEDLHSPRRLYEIARARIWFSRHCYDHHSDFANEIARSTSLISGRYHAICMSISSRTPFLAVDSNTFKIRALLTDIGLESRCVTATVLSNPNRTDSEPTRFSEQEQRAISDFLANAKTSIKQMFDQILANE